jgi:hypothetical protein
MMLQPVIDDQPFRIVMHFLGDRFCSRFFTKAGIGRLSFGWPKKRQLLD